MESNKQPLVKFELEDPITLGTVYASSMLDALNVTEFGNQVVNYVNAHPGIHLMLNFENVHYLSSAALTELLRINESAVATNGGVRLCGLSDEIKKVFRITNLDKLFVIHDEDTVHAAIRRYQRAVSVAEQEEAWDKRNRDF